MTLEEKIKAAQEEVAAQKAQPKDRRRGPTTRDYVCAAMDDGLSDRAAVLRYVLAKQGFRSAGLDAMSDDDLSRVCAAGRTVDMTLRAERRKRGE